ncbi:hypothetical protein BgiMline_027281 [Biomphalaria glabrata]|nr:hypothetical protein BgiMline_025082 [Biomphalaria glabrata]
MDRSAKKNDISKACDIRKSPLTDLEVQLEGRKLNFNESLKSAIYLCFNPKFEAKPKDIRVINVSADTFVEFLDTIKFNLDSHNYLWTIQIFMDLWETVLALQIPELIVIVDKKICRLMCAYCFKTKN